MLTKLGSLRFVGYTPELATNDQRLGEVGGLEINLLKEWNGKRRIPINLAALSSVAPSVCQTLVISSVAIIRT